MDKDIVFAHWDTGDWVALYIDDKLVREGHSISNDDLVSALNIMCRSIVVPYVEETYTPDHAPKSLKELEKITKKLYKKKINKQT